MQSRARAGLAFLAALCLAAFVGPSFAQQSKSARVLGAGDAYCPPTGSAPTTVMVGHATRQGYEIYGGTVNVRLNFSSTTAMTSDLSTSSTSSRGGGVLPAYGFITDGQPSVNVLPVICQSTGTVGTTISFIEFGQ